MDYEIVKIKKNLSSHGSLLHIYQNLGQWLFSGILSSSQLRRKIQMSLGSALCYALFTCWSRSAAIMVVWTFFFLLFSIPLYVLLLYGQMMRVNDEVEERWQAA